MATVGSTLVHSTLGWHSPVQVNTRYNNLFRRNAFDATEIEVLEKLWIIRHSVAHNAGIVIHFDAMRIGDEMLSDHAVDIGGDYVMNTFDFLSPLAQRITSRCGESLLTEFFVGRRERGPDFVSDISVYTRLKHLSSYVDSRVRELPEINRRVYEEDFHSFAN